MLCTAQKKLSFTTHSIKEKYGKTNTVLILFFSSIKIKYCKNFSFNTTFNNVVRRSESKSEGVKSQGQGVSKNITFCIQFRDKYSSNQFTKITKGIQFGFAEILETKRPYSLKNYAWVYVQLIFTKKNQ